MLSFDIVLIAIILLDCDRLRQVAREVDVDAFGNSKPIRNKLQRNDVEKTLQTINSPRYLNTLSFGRWELWIIRVADNDGTAFAGNN